MSAIFFFQVNDSCYYYDVENSIGKLLVGIKASSSFSLNNLFSVTHSTLHAPGSIKNTANLINLPSPNNKQLDRFLIIWCMAQIALEGLFYELLAVIGNKWEKTETARHCMNKKINIADWKPKERNMFFQKKKLLFGNPESCFVGCLTAINTLQNNWKNLQARARLVQKKIVCLHKIFFVFIYAVNCQTKSSVFGFAFDGFQS